MKKAMLLLILGVFVGCANKKAPEKYHAPHVVDLSKTFASEYDTLSFLSVPMTITPSSWDTMHKQFVEKYGNKGGWELLKHPYARLTETHHYKALLFIESDETKAPLLMTIDKDAEPIDTLFLFRNYDAHGANGKSLEKAIINSDFTVQLTDSSSNVIYKIDEGGEIVEVK